MRRFATPGVHDVDYAEKLKHALGNHTHSFTKTTDAIQTFLTKTLPLLTRSTPEHITPFYTSFIACGATLAKSLSDFPTRLQPLLDYLQRISEDHDHVCASLDIYQGALLAVRKAATETAIDTEREALLRFVDDLVNLNRNSNGFPIALLTVYSASCRQAVYDLTPVLQSVEALQATPPDASTLSAEEVELAEYLTQLENEVNGATVAPNPE
jgi:hypothetical protein